MIPSNKTDCPSHTSIHQYTGIWGQNKGPPVNAPSLVVTGHGPVCPGGYTIGLWEALRDRYLWSHLWSCHGQACRTQSRRCCRTGCGTPPGSCSGAGSWRWGWSCCRPWRRRSASGRGSRGCWWSARWRCCHWGRLTPGPPCYWWSGGPAGGSRGGGCTGHKEKRNRKGRGFHWWIFPCSWKLGLLLLGILIYIHVVVLMRESTLCNCTNILEKVKCSVTPLVHYQVSLHFYILQIGCQ